MSAQTPEVRLIEWIDSTGMAGWQPSDEVLGLSVSTCVSVGFVVKEDETQVLLAASIDRMYENVSDVTAIPKVCIVIDRTLRASEASS